MTGTASLNGTRGGGQAVSVIVPVHNGAATLGHCLESIQGQEGLAEVIVVDDGSTDDTAAVAREHAQFDPRIRLLRQAAAGVSTARNRGIDEAISETLVFVDADDWLEPGALAMMTVAQREHEAQLVIGQAQVSHCGEVSALPIELSRACGGVCSPEHAIHAFIAGYPDVLTGSIWRCLIDRRLIEGAHVRFRQAMTCNEDQLFLAQLLQLRPRIAVVDSVVYTVRRDGIGTSTTRRYMPSLEADKAVLHQALGDIACDYGLDEELGRLETDDLGHLLANLYVSDSPVRGWRRHREARRLIGEWWPRIRARNLDSARRSRWYPVVRAGAQSPFVLDVLMRVYTRARR